MPKDKPKGDKKPKQVKALPDAPEFVEPTYSIIMGEHPELVGQFTRSEKGKAQCTSGPEAMGPDMVRYPYMQKYIDYRGELRDRSK